MPRSNQTKRKRSDTANQDPQQARHDEPAPPRAWQRMLSGRRLDLLAPDPADIDIEDIAHGLARVARWNGQTVGEHAFSVAQHVLVVESIARDRNPRWPVEWCRAALLHDAPEYVVGDLISPFKTAIGYDYKAFESRLLAAIHRRFSLPEELPAEIAAEIKHADRIAAYFEATGLAGFTVEEARTYFGVPDGLSRRLVDDLSTLQAWPAPDAQERLLLRFREL
ncbi:MAG: YfbR-like 5'-deoxynucleotidase [Hyphomicrobiaceae bacterium]